VLFALSRQNNKQWVCENN